MEEEKTNEQKNEEAIAESEAEELQELKDYQERAKKIQKDLSLNDEGTAVLYLILQELEAISYNSSS